MKKHEVSEIIMPPANDLADRPYINAEDNITEAIEVLLNNDLKQIAVKKNNAVIGMIKLEDALETIGLESNLKTKGKRIVVIHGRKLEIKGADEH
jgi:predicted transcriptional regulator